MEKVKILTEEEYRQNLVADKTTIGTKEERLLKYLHSQKERAIASRNEIVLPFTDIEKASDYCYFDGIIDTIEDILEILE